MSSDSEDCTVLLYNSLLLCGAVLIWILRLVRKKIIEEPIKHHGRRLVLVLYR